MQSASTASNINMQSFSLPRWFDEELGCRKVTDAVPNCEIAKWHKLPNDQIAKWPIHCIRILSFQKLFRQYFPSKFLFVNIFLPPSNPTISVFHHSPSNLIWWSEAKNAGLSLLTSKWGPPPHTWSDYQWNTSPYLIILDHTGQIDIQVGTEIVFVTSITRSACVKLLSLG